MDNLSKLGFVAVEYLLKEIHLSEKYLPEEIGIVLKFLFLPRNGRKTPGEHFRPAELFPKPLRIRLHAAQHHGRGDRHPAEN
jgi:hypothetical protein